MIKFKTKKENRPRPRRQEAVSNRIKSLYTEAKAPSLSRFLISLKGLLSGSSIAIIVTNSARRKTWWTTPPWRIFFLLRSGRWPSRRNISWNVAWADNWNWMYITSQHLSYPLIQFYLLPEESNVWLRATGAWFRRHTGMPLHLWHIIQTNRVTVFSGYTSVIPPWIRQKRTRPLCDVLVSYSPWCTRELIDSNLRLSKFIYIENYNYVKYFIIQKVKDPPRRSQKRLGVGPVRLVRTFCMPDSFRGSDRQ